MENNTPKKETDNIEDQIHELEDLRTGDLVGIIDADDSFWRTCRERANCMGIIVHTNCVTAGSWISNKLADFTSKKNNV